MLPARSFRLARYPPGILNSRYAAMHRLNRSIGALAIMRQVRLLPADDGTWAYSVRNACIGSIRDALHAGTKQASAATTSSVAATAAKIAGSSGRVP
jgi:hypothetical protein